RRELDLLRNGAGVAERLKLSRQRVGLIHLIVPIRTDQHHMPQLRSGQQFLQQVERCAVDPLQVVEQQRQRVLGLGEDADEASKDQLKAVLRLLQRKLWNWRLLADDELELGKQVDHELSVGTQRLQEVLAPLREFGLALAEKRTDQALASLHECRIGDIALRAVALARREQPAAWKKRPVQLVDDRVFADARIAGDQHQLRRTTRGDAIEGGEQFLDLARPAVELFGDQQAVGNVVLAERERGDAPMSLPFGETAPQVSRDARGGLV